MSHLALSDRIAIECGIYQRLSLKEIASKIGRTPKCVANEIKNNCTLAPGELYLGKIADFPQDAELKACVEMKSVIRCVFHAGKRIAAIYAADTITNLV